MRLPAAGPSLSGCQPNAGEAWLEKLSKIFTLTCTPTPVGMVMSRGRRA